MAPRPIASRAWLLARAALVALLTWSACTHRPLDLPSLSTTELPDGDIVDASLAPQDLSTPFPFSSTIGTAVNGFPACIGWTIVVHQVAGPDCEGSHGAAISLFINGNATGTYPSVSSAVEACMSQSVWATYSLGVGTESSEIPMSGTLTVTKVKLGSSSSDDATIDGSYDFTVQDGSGLRFVGDFHGVPCTF